jgi:hypothetical protein
VVKVVTLQEIEELPELTEETLARMKFNKGGRHVSSDPRKLISLRLTADVIERCQMLLPLGMRCALNAARQRQGGSGGFMPWRATLGPEAVARL